MSYFKKCSEEALTKYIGGYQEQWVKEHRNIYMDVSLFCGCYLFEKNLLP